MKLNPMLTLYNSLSIAMITFFVGGCATEPVKIPTATGALTVKTFRYIPAESRRVEPHQIRNTAFCCVFVENDVKDYFRDRVVKHLESAGLRLDNPNRELSGEILEFLVEDIGLTADWTLTVKYRVQASGSTAPLYESVKTTKSTEFKGLPLKIEAITRSVQELLTDPVFTRAIN